MPEKQLNIISFDIPYPPDYGGVIDVFFKIKTLYSKGIKIHLHCFEYKDRSRSDELIKYCASVSYYKRKIGFLNMLSSTPYIVKSRQSEQLLNKLLENDYPILFEGLHSCFLISHPVLTKRLKIYRASNIEHHYYWDLHKASRNILKKAYFLIEMLKLKWYQHKLKVADLMLAVSLKDESYLKKKFPDNKIEHLPSFHANNILRVSDGKGNFALYHGNLEVAENIKAVSFLIKKVFSKISYPFIIAGRNPPIHLKKLASKHDHISVVGNPVDAWMNEIIQEAHINVMITFQATGLKLKLINSLYQGRFCLANSQMLAGTNLDSLCIIANTPIQLITEIEKLSTIEFTTTDISERNIKLDELYSNEKNAYKLMELIF